MNTDTLLFYRGEGKQSWRVCSPWQTLLSGHGLDYHQYFLVANLMTQTGFLDHYVKNNDEFLSLGIQWLNQSQRPESDED